MGEKAKRCSFCGQFNRADEVLCSGCGALLPGAPATPVPPPRRSSFLSRLVFFLCLVFAAGGGWYFLGARARAIEEHQALASEAQRAASHAEANDHLQEAFRLYSEGSGSYRARHVDQGRALRESLASNLLAWARAEEGPDPTKAREHYLAVASYYRDVVAASEAREAVARLDLQEARRLELRGDLRAAVVAYGTLAATYAEGAAAVEAEAACRRLFGLRSVGVQASVLSLRDGLADPAGLTRALREMAAQAATGLGLLVHQSGDPAGPAGSLSLSYSEAYGRAGDTQVHLSLVVRRQGSSQPVWEREFTPLLAGRIRWLPEPADNPAQAAALERLRTSLKLQPLAMAALAPKEVTR